MPSPLLTLARRVVAAWRAHQRAKRFARLCRTTPDLSAAAEALQRDRKRHRSTRKDLAAVKMAMSERLRREIAG